MRRMYKSVGLGLCMIGLLALGSCLEKTPEELSGPVTQIPIPNSLSAVVGATQVSLSWNFNSTFSFSKFFVYRSEDGGWVIVATIPGRDSQSVGQRRLYVGKTPARPRVARGAGELLEVKGRDPSMTGTGCTVEADPGLGHRGLFTHVASLTTQPIRELSSSSRFLKNKTPGDSMSDVVAVAIGARHARSEVNVVGSLPPGD